MKKLTEGYYLNKKEKVIKYLYSSVNFTFGINGLIDFYQYDDGKIVSYAVDASQYVKVKIVCQLKRK